MTYWVGRGDLHPLVVPWASTELEIGMDMGPESPCRPTLLAQLRKHCPCRTRPLSNPRFSMWKCPGPGKGGDVIFLIPSIGWTSYRDCVTRFCIVPGNSDGMP